MGSEEFVRQVQHTLRLAGYDVMEKADGPAPGVRVSPTPAGALVDWSPLGGQSPPTTAGGKPAVQAAIEAVLLQHGHTIWTDPRHHGIAVLLTHQTPPTPPSHTAPGGHMPTAPPAGDTGPRPQTPDQDTG